MKKLLKKFRSVQTRHGFYSVGMIAVVIVIAVVVNLIVGQLPEKWKQVDVSNKNIYGVSKTSKKTKYQYVVTALDRLHNESKGTKKKVKL